MANDPILHLLGLAKKAGKLEIGEEPVGAVCRSRHARVLLLASDAAPNTCRRAAHFGEAGNVLWLQLPHTKDELGWVLGRKSCAMLAVTDFGLAAAIGEKLALLDPRYIPACEQLRLRSDRALQRQREKRQHEKNVREGKRKPWAPPPKEPPRPPHPAGEPGPRGERRERPAPPAGKSFAPRTGRVGGPKPFASKPSAPKPSAFKPGRPAPGGKKLTARTTPGGKRPSKP